MIDARRINTAPVLPPIKTPPWLPFNTLLPEITTSSISALPVVYSTVIPALDAVAMLLLMLELLSTMLRLPLRFRPELPRLVLPSMIKFRRITGLAVLLVMLSAPPLLAEFAVKLELKTVAVPSPLMLSIRSPPTSLLSATLETLP